MSDNNNNTISPARTRRESVVIVLSAIKANYKNYSRIQFADISAKSDISYDETSETLNYLADAGFIAVSGNALTGINDGTFKTFNITSVSQAKAIGKETRAENYQNSEKPRLPRKRIKNDVRFVVKKSEEHSPGKNRHTGNRCGHEKDVLPVFKLPEGQKKRPPVTSLLFKKLSNYYQNPKKFMPEVNGARKRFTKGKVFRQQRSERREAVILLLGAILAHLDLVTMRVGCPVADGFAGIKLESLAKFAGISFTRAEEAARDLNKSELIGTCQRSEKNPDGTYKGFAAIRVVSNNLFKAFGLLDQLKEAQQKLKNRAAKKLAAYKGETLQTKAESQAYAENMISQTMAAMGIETKQESSMVFLRTLFPKA